MARCAALIFYLFHAGFALAPKGSIVEPRDGPPADRAAPPVDGRAAPDPSRGERYDGRPPVGPTLSDDLKLIPRLLLTPPRLLLRAISWPIEELVTLDERHHLLGRLWTIFTSADGLVGVRPAVAYALRLSPGGGVTFFDQRHLGPGTDMRVTVAGGAADLIVARAQVRPTTRRQRYTVDLDAGYEQRGDLFFGGVGLASDGGAQANSAPVARYEQKAVDVRAVYERPFYRALRLRAALAYGFRRYGPGTVEDAQITQLYCRRDARGACVSDRVDDALVPGFSTGADFLRPEVSLLVDSRDHAGAPAAGVIADAAVSYMQGLDAASSRAFRLRSSVAGAFEVVKRAHVIVLRLRLDTLLPVASEPVPFSELVTLGGPDDLRGFVPNRFRDLSSVLLTAEYRFAIWMWADATLFADYGGTFGRAFSGFALDRMVPDVGGGIRIRTEGSFYIRLQVAYGFGGNGDGGGIQLFLSASTGL